jgi:hypothetical protein
MQPEIKKEQPLFVQDFANDKNGVTVSNKFDVKHYTNVGINESTEKKGMCSECGGKMYENECMECGWKGEMGEETQQVKDLKNVEDLNLSDKFDYVEGDMKEDDALDALSMQDVTGQEAPHMSTDMAPDGMDDDSDNDRKMMADGEMEETQQGNPYDNEQSAYSFVSDGPLQEYDPMESAWSDDKGETKEQYPPKHVWNKMKRKIRADKEGEEFDDTELDMSDYEEFEPNTSSWEDITTITGDDEFSHLDEDIKESVVEQKNKILEMIKRMKTF